MRQPVVCQQLPKDILKNSLLISEISHPYKVCVTLFTERQEEFHKASTLFNAWYSCLIEISNETGTPTGVRLESSLPAGFIDFNLQSISSNYDFERIKAVFIDALTVPDEMLQHRCLEFSLCEKNKAFRGKYELDFVLKFIKLLLEDSSTTKKFLKEKIRFNFGNPNNDQALNIFSSSAEEPESLLEYLRRVTSD